MPNTETLPDICDTCDGHLIYTPCEVGNPWSHVDPARDSDHRAVIRPRCPGCGKHGVVVTAEAWGDRWACDFCDYERFASIGD